MSEDGGFAINGGKGWSDVVFTNHQIDLNGPIAIAMGSYLFTCAATAEQLHVEYTFGYKRNSDGKARIFLHHSSVPYSEPPLEPPDAAVEAPEAVVEAVEQAPTKKSKGAAKKAKKAAGKAEKATKAAAKNQKKEAEVVEAKAAPTAQAVVTAEDEHKEEHKETAVAPKAVAPKATEVQVTINGEVETFPLPPPLPPPSPPPPVAPPVAPPPPEVPDVVIKEGGVDFRSMARPPPKKAPPANVMPTMESPTMPTMEPPTMPTMESPTMPTMPTMESPTMPTMESPSRQSPQNQGPDPKDVKREPLSPQPPPIVKRQPGSAPKPPAVQSVRPDPQDVRPLASDFRPASVTARPLSKKGFRGQTIAGMCKEQASYIPDTHNTGQTAPPPAAHKKDAKPPAATDKPAKADGGKRRYQQPVVLTPPW